MINAQDPTKKEIERFVTTELSRARFDVTSSGGGWDACPDSDFCGIQVRFAKRHPSTASRGWLVEDTALVTLTHQFENVHPALAEISGRLSPAGRKNLRLSIALHEFGHALSLRHEDGHPDAPCDEFDEHLYGDEIVAVDYDFFSFMNRCLYGGFDYDSGAVAMSKRDVLGLYRLYFGAPEGVICEDASNDGALEYVFDQRCLQRDPEDALHCHAELPCMAVR